VTRRFCAHVCRPQTSALSSSSRGGSNVRS
jgi:hypothetical protein